MKTAKDDEQIPKAALQFCTDLMCMIWTYFRKFTLITVCRPRPKIRIGLWPRLYVCQLIVSLLNCLKVITLKGLLHSDWRTALHKPSLANQISVPQNGFNLAPCRLAKLPGCSLTTLKPSCLPTTLVKDTLEKSPHWHNNGDKWGSRLSFYSGDMWQGNVYWKSKCLGKIKIKFLYIPFP